MNAPPFSRSQPRVHLAALGCRLNEAELQTWSRQFLDRGCELSASAEQADLVIVNTCAVTGEAVRKSRQLVRRAQKAQPTARLVVSGCYAATAEQGELADLGIDLVVQNSEKNELVARVFDEFDLPLMPAAAMAPEASLLPSGRHRAFVKVQDGCRYRCTYCIVTHARGDERSRPVDEVIAEINALQQAGVREAVLTGVHLGGYGHDLGEDLAHLVRSILEQTTMPRLRLGSLEPWDLPADFWSLFEDPRLMPHLHLPIQSGSDSVLRRMARRCRTDEFAQLVDAGRTQVPDLNVTTDIIVGFPGETNAEWAQTLAFAETMAFGHIHIFAYSPRTGTKAARLPDQLPRELKRERSRELHGIAQTSRTARLEQQIGRTLPVLFESSEPAAAGKTAWRGYTSNYFPVWCETDAAVDLDNRIETVRPADSNGAELVVAL